MGMTQVKEKRAARIARMANHPDTDLLVLKAFVSADTGKSYVAGDVISRSVISEAYYDLLVAATAIVSIKDYLLDGDVDYESIITAAIDIGTVPNGATLTATTVDLTEAFDGGAEASVGTAADKDLYMESSEIDMTETDAQPKVQSALMGADTAVKMYIDAVAPTTGEGIASVQYDISSDAASIDHTDGNDVDEAVISLTGAYNKVTNIRMVVSEAFDVGTRLTVGDSITGPTKFVESSDVDLTAVATTNVAQDETYAVSVDISANLTTKPDEGSVAIRYVYTKDLTEAAITFEDTPSIVVGTIPAGGIVVNLAYDVTEAFDGGTSLSVGTVVNEQRFYPASSFDPYTVAIDTLSINEAMSAATEIKVFAEFVDDAAPSAGETIVTVIYEKEFNSAFDHTLNGIPVFVLGVEDDYVITSVTVNVSEAFDGTPTLTIGVPSDHDKVVELLAVDLTTVAVTNLTGLDVNFVSEDSVYIYYGATTPTTGHATITVVMEIPLETEVTFESTFPVTLGTVPKYAIVKSVDMDTSVAWDAKPYVTFGVDGSEEWLNDGASIDLTVVDTNDVVVEGGCESETVIKAFLHNTSVSSTGEMAVVLRYLMDSSEAVVVTHSDFAVDESSVELFTVPAGAIVTNIEGVVSEAFNGIPGLGIGISADHTLVAREKDINLATTGENHLTPGVAVVAGGTISAYPISYESSTGTVSVRVDYTKMVSSATFDHTDITTDSVLLGSIPANRTVTLVSLEVTEGFVGDSIEITVGDASDKDRLMGATDNDPSVADTYETEPDHLYASETPIRLYIKGVSATAGAATVSVTYE